MKPTDSGFHYSLEFFINELKDMLHLRIPMVFLKQFRDVADASKACYQAVIEANGFLKGFHGGSLLSGNYQFMLNHMDTHPMGQDFGIGEVSPIGHAFRIEVDLFFDNGTEVWRGI